MKKKLFSLLLFFISISLSTAAFANRFVLACPSTQQLQYALLEPVKFLVTAPVQVITNNEVPFLMAGVTSSNHALQFHSATYIGNPKPNNLICRYLSANDNLIQIQMAETTPILAYCHFKNQDHDTENCSGSLTNCELDCDFN